MTRINNQLLSLLLSGDEESFKAVYNHFYSRLSFFVSQYVVHPDITENIIQDTFLTLWLKRSSLKADTNLNAYVFTVAKNNCLKRLRDQKYRNKIMSSQVSEAEIELNTNALFKLDTNILAFEEINAIVKTTLESLPPTCKLVFEMSRFQMLRNQEIADTLGTSVKTVEGHITKAIKVLKNNLKDYLPLLSAII
ncbi:RNA polymerase sigma-70 factor [Mangrovibacterium lignilyticum]|uniref:RNA polymerase sigma-70 factor n=1 Tax=Mangrovibacterium lignilyticum TaxID=2668052 RepID=UPI0013D1F7B9|nr:RNA polymerase sigma-70 factor [Mangrovibacterium lignilyticum]